ncbi:mannitol dehydrogenase family protein [Parendozoicomonas haliclonae]|uniref:Polyol:NADP oxidoreductase n=1 Tax=Parendozoicomonas haliclonae TaxID=1960125 RepID=A0A1X7AQB6_9GAMM|nr:mannitol dehydrogenase family protein [Parendozoicomonas haliclonae]SMA49604.1 Polyol:NADP oxidoreductase [Parendozoicomonas haliclonae]
METQAHKLLNRETAEHSKTIRKTKTYDLPLQPGIVHLGLGAFHRAHQALITDETMASTDDEQWGIVAANIRSGARLVEQLKQQDHLFTVTETSKEHGLQCRLISSLVETHFAGADEPNNHNHQRLLATMALPDIRIVSLTITEKGYGLNPATGELLDDHPLIHHDLHNPDSPRSAIGLIVAALSLRKRNDLHPFTVLSCDNIPDNGSRTRQAVLQMAERLDKDLASWIHQYGAFPSTMVDRIVPAITDEDLNNVEQNTGLRDNCAIVCESFKQWVIEDNFVGGENGRPDWDCIDGVQFVEDVRPWEEMKLRMLNGAHSFIAYTGLLAGYQTVAEVMEDQTFADAAKHVMVEAAPTLVMPDGADLADYADSLITRFQNPHLAHKTTQIASDGSQKIPQRWLNTVRWHLAHGSDFSLIAAGIAAWISCMSTMEITDPMATQLREIAAQHTGNISELTKAFIACSDIFGEDLSHNIQFIETVVQSAEQLHQQGIKTLLHSLIEKT